MVQSSVLAVAGSIAVLLVTLARFFRGKGDQKGPPVVKSSIPLVGHLIGMIRHKVYYYQILRDRTNAPIFSVPILGSHIYVVKSPQLITAVQRMTKALAFEPIVAKATQRVSGCSVEANRIINTNIDGKDGERGYVITFFKTMHAPLMPGTALDAMNRTMIRYIETSANSLASTSTKRINLCDWLRHELTMATTTSVYGPAHPFTTPGMEAAFWNFEDNLMMLLINIFPSITARKAVLARTLVANAFYDYFTKNQHRNGSALVQARYDHSQEYGVSVKDIATFEVGGCLALLANTFPTAYWMLSYIYSHPDVLQECRDEVAHITTSLEGEDGFILHSIDMSTIKNSCPVITATLQEVLRHTAVGSTVREVTEDCTLDGYVLKKGCTLLTAANVLHTDPSIWGPSTASFDHRRFLRTPGKKLPNPVAFRAFGGGATLCPGRHFATTEVLAMATMFIARFDMTPVGNWPGPARESAKLWTQILEPNPDFQVDISERREFLGKHRWTFSLSESEILLAMAAEDLEGSKE